MSSLTSIFGEIRIGTSEALEFLNECAERAANGENLDHELVLNEARNMITATIHPSTTNDSD